MLSDRTAAAAVAVAAVSHRSAAATHRVNIGNLSNAAIT